MVGCIASVQKRDKNFYFKGNSTLPLPPFLLRPPCQNPKYHEIISKFQNQSKSQLGKLQIHCIACLSLISSFMKFPPGNCFPLARLVRFAILIPFSHFDRISQTRKYNFQIHSFFVQSTLCLRQFGSVLTGHGHVNIKKERENDEYEMKMFFFLCGIFDLIKSSFQNIFCDKGKEQKLCWMNGLQFHVFCQFSELRLFNDENISNIRSYLKIRIFEYSNSNFRTFKYENFNFRTFKFENSNIQEICSIK